MNDQSNVSAFPDRGHTRRLPRPKGHEIMLAGAIKRRAKIRLTLTDGAEVVGAITQFDSYTITLRPDSDDQTPCTYFKHAIESFRPYQDA